MPFWKRMLFKLAGMKYDRIAARLQQHYHFIFVREEGDGAQQAALRHYLSDDFVGRGASEADVWVKKSTYQTVSNDGDM